MKHKNKINKSIGFYNNYAFKVSKISYLMVTTINKLWILNENINYTIKYMNEIFQKDIKAMILI